MQPIRIESVAHGGDGVGTAADGKRIFVPLAAPGDLVEARIVEDRGRHARAALARLIEPGPGRVEPACRHAGSCGGCQLPHLSYDTQVRAKEDAFYEALARLGECPRASIDAALPILPSPSPLRYRIRCKLAVRGKRAGYLRRQSDELEAVDECSLLVPALEALALRVIESLRDRPIPHLASVDLCVGDDGSGAAYLEPASGAPQGWDARAADLLRIEGVRGVIAAPAVDEPTRGQGRAAPPGQRAVPRVFGDPVVSRDAPGAPGVRLLGRPDVFAQANSAANEALVEAAVESLAIAPGDEVLELYCGAGNFTFALASRGAKVTAVEAEGASLALARRASEASRPRDVQLRFIAGDAVRVAAGFADEGRRFDAVLLDPPRAGAKGLAPILARLAPRRIAYVSCDPPTLARDVKALRAAGYRPILARPVDMFPQTFHVEGLVAFERMD